MTTHIQNFKSSMIVLVLLFIIQLPFSERAEAQNTRPDVEFIQLFNALQQDLPRERVHLHTDRQWYFYGDRIWFSSYVTSGNLNAPSLISKVLYVELYSPEGEFVRRIAVENKEGRGKGSISIEHNGAPGMYKLKAYTAWSKNFGDSYGFTRNIPVHTGEGQPEVTHNASFDISFFPEGGDLVEGIESRVGFKAIGSDGHGKSVSGVIYDGDDSIIADIESEHLGMGAFSLKPESGQTYYAVVNGERFPLPDALPTGLVFSVTENDFDQYVLRLRSSDTETDRSYLVFGHVRGEIYVATPIDVISGTGFTAAPKTMFETGAVHFTVLSSDGTPIAERLAFNINPADSLNSSVSTGKDVYSLRDRVDLSISLNDAASDVVDAMASVSVFDDELQEYDHYSSTIKTKFLLESDIAGHVENPGYYFSDSKSRGKHADLLMLTQGWRAFDMEQVQNAEEINIFSMPEDGIRLTGQIRSSFRGRGLADATVVFSMGSDQEDLQIVDTDEDGYFSITGLNVTGSQPISIRANDSDGGDNVRIRLSEPYSHLPEVTASVNQERFSPITISRGDDEDRPSAEELSERAVSTQMQTEEFADVQMRGELEEVVVAAERDTDDQFERDLRVASAGSQRVDLDERPELTTLPIESIVNQIPGVTANVTGLSIRTGSVSFSGAAPPLVILDGIESDWNVVQNISPTDVQTINVFRRSTELAAYGSRGAGGVLMVRTRRGSGAAPSTRGFTTAFVEGYQSPTRFYSPRYGFTVAADSEEPDNRITLHWDADVELTDGKAELSFWTNDIPSTYRVVVEGLDEFGLPFTDTVTIRTSAN